MSINERPRTRGTNWFGTAALIAFAAGYPVGGCAPANSGEADTAITLGDDALTTTGWKGLGGVITSAPALVRTSTGKVFAFARGGDGALYLRTSDDNADTWSAWAGLGGIIVGEPAAAAYGNGKVRVFARGSDNGLYFRAFDGSNWGAWTGLGGVIGASPAPVTDGDNMWVFVKGGSALYYRKFTGESAGGWVSLGGVITSTPIAVNSGPGRIDVFVRGGDGAVYQRKVQNGVVANWEGLGGYIVGDPAVASDGQGKVAVFVRGGGNKLYARLNNGSAFAPWIDLGGILVGSPTALFSSGRVKVFVRGSDNGLYSRTLENGTWSAFAGHGGVMTTQPTSLALADGRVIAALRGTDNGLYQFGSVMSNAVEGEMAAERRRVEEARLAAEQAERERVAAEEARLAAERAEQERLAAEQARLAAEQAQRIADAARAEEARLARLQALGDTTGCTGQTGRYTYLQPAKCLVLSSPMSGANYANRLYLSEFNAPGLGSPVGTTVRATIQGNARFSCGGGGYGVTLTSSSPTECVYVITSPFQGRGNAALNVVEVTGDYVVRAAMGAATTVAPTTPSGCGREENALQGSPQSVVNSCMEGTVGNETDYYTVTFPASTTNVMRAVSITGGTLNCSGALLPNPAYPGTCYVGYVGAAQQGTFSVTRRADAPANAAVNYKVNILSL